MGDKVRGRKGNNPDRRLRSLMRAKCSEGSEISRTARVKRISGNIYEEARSVLKLFLENLIKDATTYTEHAKRKTVTAMDVVYSLKKAGRTIYGFGT